jgi:hypothetical protein
VGDAQLYCFCDGWVKLPSGAYAVRNCSDGKDLDATLAAAGHRTAVGFWPHLPGINHTTG